ncbi:Metallo-hydrolase/oxidoreductase [Saccharata proteae CBS 121410]|uniref:Metallo-hydrolase/oxidoreductase n=1 Tax=Saccharata proteae CBS 121410 TaxID=1314787 RepID=A0A9P4LTC1_9PEZI|nr:Metallo-hydrolase/oxidoreductase [Saccharata proteae CBS 121410]
MPHLPPSSPHQPFVTISPISAGTITLPSAAFISPATPSAQRTVPSLCFLITHPGHSTDLTPASSSHAHRPIRIMFDLGLRSNLSRYLPAQQQHLSTRTPYRLAGVATQLAAGGVAVDEISTVVLSHVHYDHHGDAGDFAAARFVVGNGALAVLRDGLEGKGSHQCFDGGLFGGCAVEELPPVGWRRLGPFDAALDLLGDGSVFVIDAPGHLPGHVNLLCRTGDASWVCLAGDSFHDPRLLRGEKEIGTWEDAAGNTLCIHLDREAAEKTIARLRVLDGIDGVQIIAAHDVEWCERNKDKMFPATL